MANLIKLIQDAEERDKGLLEIFNKMDESEKRKFERYARELLENYYRKLGEQ